MSLVSPLSPVSTMSLVSPVSLVGPVSPLSPASLVSLVSPVGPVSPLAPLYAVSLCPLLVLCSLWLLSPVRSRWPMCPVRHCYVYVSGGGGGGGELVRISSDRYDRRGIFGLKFSLLGFFGQENLTVMFFGIQNNLKIHASARVSWPQTTILF